MVFRRKTKRTLKRKHKRPVARRRPVAASRPKASSMLVKRTLYGGTWTFGTATTFDFWRYLSYNVGSMNNFAEFAAIFDEYKVNGIKLTFRPAYDSTINATTVGGVVNQPQAYAHVVVDPASSTLPSGVYSSSLNTFLEQDRVRTHTLNKPFSVYFRPKVLEQALGGSTGGVMKNSPWVRTSDTGVDYRGVHMFLQQNSMSTTNINIKLDVFITFYVAFKNLK